MRRLKDAFSSGVGFAAGVLTVAVAGAIVAGPHPILEWIDELRERCRRVDLPSEGEAGHSAP